MIIRAESKDNHTQIPNEILNNLNLSAKAKGIMAQLLSKPDNWKFNIQDQVNTNKEGQVAIRSAIKELEQQNYIHWFVIRLKNGRREGNEYLIYDRVTPNADAQAMFKKIYGNGGAR